MATNTEETLLVAEDDDGVAMSLFLDAGMLERLESDSPLDRLHVDHLDDFWKVLEGISHFNCMTWKAMRERSVSLLELELQGEIDKYVTTTLLALGQADRDILNSLHGWLFDEVSYHPELAETSAKRYRAANDYAARFCRALHSSLVSDGELALESLRRFFRLQFRDKISHIHAHAW
jgi:hypothetical protein